MTWRFDLWSPLALAGRAWDAVVALAALLTATVVLLHATALPMTVGMLSLRCIVDLVFMTVGLKLACHSATPTGTARCHSRPCGLLMPAH
jgi:hypothetical protein